MGLELKNKFKDAVEFDKFFGVTGVRIVMDTKGNPIINPTLEQLAEHFDGYDTKKDEKTYTSEFDVTWGYTDLLANGGKKRITKQELDALPPQEREDLELEKAKSATVSFLVETVDDLKLKKIISFRFNNVKDITKNGKKIKVYNKFGQVAYMSEDNTFAYDSFKGTSEDGVKAMPSSSGTLGFEELLKFLYAYAAINRDVNLAESLDVEAMFEGDFSSIVEVVDLIHSDVVTSENKPLYGAIVLFTVENNKSTNNNYRQSYYNEFERLVLDSKGKYNSSFSYILKTIAKDRIPGANGKSYSVESRGVFVGINGVPKLGLRKFKNSLGANMLQQQAPMHTIADMPQDTSSGGFEDLEDIKWG